MRRGGRDRTSSRHAAQTGGEPGARAHASRGSPKSVAGKVAQLSRLSAPELRRRYEELFGAPPGCRSNRQYLMRRIAWRLQEVAYGGLSEKAEAKLEELTAGLDLLSTRRQRRQTERARPGAGTRRTRDRRLPMPGAVLSRDYQGRTLSVTVLGDGFEFDGRRYRSLSAIASEVTGTHWNGFAFFGLT
ncbi:DUF2924 domain-containing protein [Planctomycetota bacterium]